jgi:hypothetical protein
VQSIVQISAGKSNNLIKAFLGFPQLVKGRTHTVFENRAQNRISGHEWEKVTGFPGDIITVMKPSDEINAALSMGRDRNAYKILA